MMHKLEIIPERSLMLQYFSERVSLDDLVVALNVLVRDPRFRPNYNGLTVLNDAEVGITVAGVKHFSKIFEMHVNQPGVGRLALLVDKPSHTALSQIFQIELKRTQDIQVFNTMKAACDWLNLDEVRIQKDMEALMQKEAVRY